MCAALGYVTTQKSTGTPGECRAERTIRAAFAIYVAVSIASLLAAFNADAAPLNRWDGCCHRFFLIHDAW